LQAGFIKFSAASGELFLEFSTDFNGRERGLEIGFQKTITKKMQAGKISFAVFSSNNF
jgi:hypothetical protein